MIAQKLKDNAIPGAVVLIDKGGEGRWLQTFGTANVDADVPVRPDDYFRVGSNTKTMTATVILQLVQEGKLKLDDPVSRYYPGVPNGDTITIAQLLELRSGLPDYMDDPVFLQQPHRVWRPKELLALSFAKPVNFAPGAQFEYSNTNYILLGVIIEKVTGMAASAAFQQRIFEPLGLAHTSLPAPGDNTITDPHAHGYMFQTDAANIDHIELTPEQQAAALAGTWKPVDVTDWSPSTGWTAGSVISTAEDMATYTKALAAGGLLGDKTQQLRVDSIQPIDPSKPDGAGYGLGLARIPPHLFGHTGKIAGYDAVTGYDPNIDLLVVILTNLNDTPALKDPAVQLLSPVVFQFYGANKSNPSN
ncbi:MAG TPA: serine hydrolase domain-containing protein [Acidimicrobiales bacterium]|nr:serine hydrolase domain-containing protein [Acidimicrobiales bacterium]